MDWGAWSREAVALMSKRMRELLAKHGVEANAPYRWDLEAGSIMLGDTVFQLVAIGTVEDDDEFLWSWANDGIADRNKRGMDRVRAFGVEHDLRLLTEPCSPGGLAQAKECLAIAGRVLDAHGIWIDRSNSGFILFLLFERSPS